MLKKSLIAVLIVTMALIGFSSVYADQIDGLVSGTNGGNFPGPALPSGLDLYVNPGGLGDGLVYAYFNARDALNFVRVINTSAGGVGAKIRVREGADSNEILDFYICLSGYDQFSFWLIGDDNPNNPGQLVWYDDDTPTYPDPQGNNTAADNMLATVTLHHSGTGAAAAVSADDTKEGYLEILGVQGWRDLAGTAKAVATPLACGEILGIPGVNEALWDPTIDIGIINQDWNLDVPNVLAGNLYIFDWADLQGTYAYNATALGYFLETVMYPVTLATDSAPRLSDTTDVDASGSGINEINYVLTKSVEFALYDIETSLNGSTDIVETFPTKALSIGLLFDNGPFNDLACIDTGGQVGTYNPGPPVSCDDIVDRDEEVNGRCELIWVQLFDDEENSPTITTGFSPGETSKLVKCDEVNYITVGTGASLLNTALLQFNLNTAGFQIGWISISLGGPGANTTVNNSTAWGLPVLSYELSALGGGYWSHMLPLRYYTYYGVIG
jgi:hypothetical protein